MRPRHYSAGMPIYFVGEEPKIPVDYAATDFEHDSFPLITKTVIPAGGRNIAGYVSRFSYDWCHEYFVQVGEKDYIDFKLAPKITNWLEQHATDYFGADTLDCGDWGGSPICEINFAIEDECDAFIAEFQHIIHALTYIGEARMRMQRDSAKAD